MCKVRITGFSKVEKEFDATFDAFEWVKKTQAPGTTFSLLVYEAGKLTTMDRFFYDGKRVTMENITQ